VVVVEVEEEGCEEPRGARGSRAATKKVQVGTLRAGWLGGAEHDPIGYDGLKATGNTEGGDLEKLECVRESEWKSYLRVSGVIDREVLRCLTSWSLPLSGWETARMQIHL
jgi:hypothetical protein